VLIAVRSAAAGKNPAVECSTPVGGLTAIWRGSSPPVPGQHYHVELDIVGEITWGKELVVDPGPRDSDPTAVSGQIEHADAHTVTLRVGDSLLLLEPLGDGPPGPAGLTVRLRPTAFELWPTGI
jgi:hypothetical protein